MQEKSPESTEGLNGQQFQRNAYYHAQKILKSRILDTFKQVDTKRVCLSIHLARCVELESQNHRIS